MKAEQAQHLINLLLEGKQLETPFSTALYPETTADKNILRHDGKEYFILCTYFREFWAGHGWSMEQKEEERFTKEELLKRLVYYPVEEFVIIEDK